MKFMLRSLFMFCLLFVSSVAVHGQINSGQDIKWPTASCTSSTLYYSPFDNQCHPISGVGAPVNSLVETSSYTVVGSGEFIQMNCSSACTLTLPATITTGFTVAVMRTGAGALTINPNGVAYDGVTTGLLQDSSLFITTDGTGYHSTSPVTSYSGCTPTPSLTGTTLTCAGGSPVSVGFAISSGVVASPATPLILAPATGTVSHCYFTTNSSDGATALTFNIKFNGANIISGTNATVAAGTTAGTVSTFTLTSGTIAITAAQKWEMDITSGTSSWSGIAQCF